MRWIALLTELEVIFEKKNTLNNKVLENNAWASPKHNSGPGETWMYSATFLVCRGRQLWGCNSIFFSVFALPSVSALLFFCFLLLLEHHLGFFCFTSLRRKAKDTEQALVLVLIMLERKISKYSEYLPCIIRLFFACFCLPVHYFTWQRCSSVNVWVCVHANLYKQSRMSWCERCSIFEICVFFISVRLRLVSLWMYGLV